MISGLLLYTTIAASMGLMMGILVAMGRPITTQITIILIFTTLFGGLAYFMESSSPVYEEREVISTTPIYSIHLSDSGVYGSFRLGYGTVSSYNQYLYYKDSGTGGLLLDSVRADGTVIYQDENIRPYVKKIEFGQADVETNKIERNRPGYKVTYEIHVPKGTVVEEYKL